MFHGNGKPALLLPPRAREGVYRFVHGGRDANRPNFLLMDNALKAKQNHEWSASNRALELLGKELGMFTAADLPWDGDPATLTDRQLDQLLNYLERLAFGGDETKIQAARERAMLEAGQVVDVEPTHKAGPTDKEW